MTQKMINQIIKLVQNFDYQPESQWTKLDEQYWLYMDYNERFPTVAIIDLSSKNGDDMDDMYSRMYLMPVLMMKLKKKLLQEVDFDLDELQWGLKWGLSYHGLPEEICNENFDGVPQELRDIQDGTNELGSKYPFGFVFGVVYLIDRLS